MKGIIVKVKQISVKYISHRIWIYLPTKTNTTVQTNTANSRVKYGGPNRYKISWYTINLFSKMINYILIKVIMRNFVSTTRIYTDMESKWSTIVNLFWMTKFILLDTLFIDLWDTTMLKWKVFFPKECWNEKLNIFLIL